MVLFRSLHSPRKFIFVFLLFTFCIERSCSQEPEQIQCTSDDDCEYENTGNPLLECCENHICCVDKNGHIKCSEDEDCFEVVNVFMPSISLPWCCKNGECCSEIVYKEEAEKEEKEHYQLKFKTAVVGSIATVFVLLLLVSLSCLMFRNKCNEYSNRTTRQRFILRFSDLQLRRSPHLQNRSGQLSCSCPAYIGNTAVNSNEQPQNLPTYENLAGSPVCQQEADAGKNSIVPPKYEDLFKNHDTNDELPPRYEDLP